MSLQVVFRRIAKRELDDAISWYEGRREGLGQDSALQLNNNYRELQSHHFNSLV